MNSETSVACTEVKLDDLACFKRGKVREVFDIGEALLLVATDRVSAFDSVLPTGIPLKGHVLNQLSAWWFDRLSGVIPNHMLTTRVEDYPQAFAASCDLLRGRSMLVKKAEALPVECVARGYLIGSGWAEYQKTGSVCGIPLPPGHQLADRLQEPIFTPATKADEGHDENISFEALVKVVGPDLAERLREATMRLYTTARDYALERGIIIADTKFEFGMVDGELTLIDEALTPDSSRFWPADRYAPGQSPPSLDKQFVRDYLESVGWDKVPPAPPLPNEVVAHTTDTYVEAFRTLTGRELER